MPAAPGPEITACLIAVDYVHMRLDDTLRAQRLETALDQFGGHAGASRRHAGALQQAAEFLGIGHFIEVLTGIGNLVPGRA